MPAFPDFFGNTVVAETLRQMIDDRRITPTILLGGPEGIGKATLVRRFAAALLGNAGKIERDDLSLPENEDIIDGRERWTSDKRAEDPLFFSTHPDFLTFAPDGPLRQISIQQIRLLREYAQLKPHCGAWRIFLIDHLDRANEQSANSLLKVLEEPPEHLIIFSTAENLYDLLPTIRSRSVVLPMTRLSDEEMEQFARARNLPDAQTRIGLAEGSPGLAVTLDLQQLRERRALVLAAFECAAGVISWTNWVQQSEAFNASRSEKLDLYLKPAYSLLHDVLAAWQGSADSANRDIQARITKIAGTVSFAWIERATAQVDELVLMVRRNIQKTAALDALIINLRNSSGMVGG